MASLHGGKQRIGKQLAKIIFDESVDIEDEYDFPICGYCEPFAGMLGVYKHIPDLFDNPKMKYKAGDVNKSIIKMWQAAQKGWKPPTTISESTYNKLKKSTDSALKGYVGHQYSFGGAFFNGYAPKYGKNKDSSPASNNVVNIGVETQDVLFSSGSYKQFSNLKNYVIYCDPPYENCVQRYYEGKTLIKFDHEKFWDWCRKMADDNIVFISSYKAPEDFELVFSSTSKLTGISRGKNKTRVEKMFLIY